ncbi:MAG: glycerol-3-phosphate dehydrogenase/oxidase [Ornithinibacter sp.]
MNALRWDAEWRETSWAQLDGPWDIVVVGGGITGAGVLRAAARSGLRALLLERADFSHGASSRSSQLVHGGLRYLAQGHLRVTRDAVHSRERLLREAPGLVTPLPFLIPLRADRARERIANLAALRLYEALAGRAGRLAVRPGEVLTLAPALDRTGLRGGLRYHEARTDDARLVMRVLREAVALGALALNAVAVTDVVSARGRVRGVRVLDRPTGRTGEVRADVVVNATGAWADDLRRQVGGSPRMRPVAGSHLVFPGWRFPLAPGVNVRSPRDGRYVSVFPWEGATVVGTTDVDVGRLVEEQSITADEVTYLLECVSAAFPTLALTEADVLSTWSGVRPIVSSGARSSADELREHVVGDEGGLLTVTGGKLTTFEVAAREVLRAAAPNLQPGRQLPPTTAARPPGAPPADDKGRRLYGRHGREAGDVLADARPGEQGRITGTPTTWAEVRWSARNEAVTSIDDLMLRRTRLGLLLPDGGNRVLGSVLQICREELGWDAVRADQELGHYLAKVRRTHSIPSRAGMPVSPAEIHSSVTDNGRSGSTSS